MVPSLTLLSSLSAAFVASPLPLARHAGGRSRVSLYIAEANEVAAEEAKRAAEALAMAEELAAGLS